MVAPYVVLYLDCLARDVVVESFEMTIRGPVSRPNVLLLSMEEVRTHGLAVVLSQLAPGGSQTLNIEGGVGRVLPGTQVTFSGRVRIDVEMAQGSVIRFYLYHTEVVSNMPVFLREYVDCVPTPASGDFFQALLIAFSRSAFVRWLESELAGADRVFDVFHAETGTQYSIVEWRRMSSLHGPPAAGLADIGACESLNHAVQVIHTHHMAGLSSGDAKTCEQKIEMWRAYNRLLGDRRVGVLFDSRGFVTIDYEYIAEDREYVMVARQPVLVEAFTTQTILDAITAVFRRPKLTK